MGLQLSFNFDILLPYHVVQGWDGTFFYVMSINASSVDRDTFSTQSESEALEFCRKLNYGL